MVRYWVLSRRLWLDCRKYLSGLKSSRRNLFVTSVAYTVAMVESLAGSQYVLAWASRPIWELRPFSKTMYIGGYTVNVDKKKRQGKAIFDFLSLKKKNVVDYIKKMTKRALNWRIGAHFGIYSILTVNQLNIKIGSFLKLDFIFNRTNNQRYAI